MVPAPDAVRTRVAGRELSIVNLDKVMYPATGYTKAEVISYYSQIADVLLPYIADRALTRVRFPDGVAGPSFYEKNAPASSTYGVSAVNPTAKNSRITVDAMNVAGKPAPLPEARPSGTTPPITPSGAAAATTMKTIDGTPRLPFS